MPRRQAGFTLIELMIVVAILGILAALAVPGFGLYMRRSRTTEAMGQLKAMFSRTAMYYVTERADQGLGGAHQVDCIIGDTDNGIDPNDQKQAGDYSQPGFYSLGYRYGLGYYRYEVKSSGGRCFIAANSQDLYTLRAIGDLDNDGEKSTFELAVGSNHENELFHARGFYTINESE